MTYLERIRAARTSPEVLERLFCQQGLGNFQTVVFYEPEYSLYTLWQAQPQG